MPFICRRGLISIKQNAYRTSVRTNERIDHMDAIVYTSNTGSTKRYAELLSQMIGLPAFALGDAKDKLSANAGIIYLGWIMASGVKGYSAAAKRYKIHAVCGVGMGQTGTQLKEVRDGKPHSILRLFALYGRGLGAAQSAGLFVLRGLRLLRPRQPALDVLQRRRRGRLFC